MSAKSARTLRSENEFIGSCVIIVNRFLLGSVCGKERLKAAVEIEAVTVLIHDHLNGEHWTSHRALAGIDSCLSTRCKICCCFDMFWSQWPLIICGFEFYLAHCDSSICPSTWVGGMRWVKRQIPASKNVKIVGTCWDPTTQTVKVTQCALTAAAFTRRWKMSVCERHYSGALKSERMEMDQIFPQMQHCPK